MRTTGWKKTVYIVILTQFIGLAGGNLVFPFFPLYLKDLGIQDTGNAALISGVASLCLGLAMFVFSPIWGALADRYGRKPMLLRAYFGATITIGAQAFVQNIWQMLIARTLQGAFTGTVSAAAALVAAETPPAQVAFTMGLLQVALSISATAGPLIGGIMADAIGYRLTFIVTAIAFGLAGLLLLFGVKEDFTPPVVRRGPWETFVGNLREAASSRAVVVMVGLLFLVNASISFSRPVIPLFIDVLDPVSGGAREAGYAFAALALTSAFAALVVGAKAGKLGYRWALLITLGGSGLAYLPVAFSSSVGMLIFLMAVVGLFSGGTLPAANALLSVNSPPDKQGSAFGLAGSANALAFSFAPLLAGVVAASLGIEAVFLVLGVGTLVVTGLAAVTIPRGPAALTSISATEEESTPAG